MRTTLSNILEKVKSNKKTISFAYNISRYIISIVLTAFFIAFNFSNQFTPAFICVFIFWGVNMTYALSNLSGRMTYTLFLASFFCFLMGRMAADLFTTGVVNFYFSNEVSRHILLCIFFSLISLQFGFEFFEKYNTHFEYKLNNADKTLDLNYVSRLQQYSKIFFYLSSVFALLINIEQIVFIFNNSYLELYTNFSTKIPNVFRIFGNCNLPLLFVFLATKPDKRKCLLPIIVFGIVTASLLITGDRGMFIVNASIILIYIFWRQYLDKEIWIPTKFIVIGILCIPIAIAGMSFFVFIREGVDVGDHTFTAQFLRFFRSTGNTIDLLGYGKEYQNKFTQNFYSFGELIDYIKYNPISQVVLGVTKPTPHTQEYATTMHSYAHMISYIITPELYLEGHGKGSSYIAEVYHDFSYLGVILCNIIYGVLLSALYKLKKTGPIITAAFFIGIRIMFYVPRGAMIMPVTYVLNITTLTVLIGMWLLAKYYPFIISCLNLKKLKKEK